MEHVDVSEKIDRNPEAWCVFQNIKRMLRFRKIEFENQKHRLNSDLCSQ